MANIRIGVICPSEIAFRRFLPSLQKVKGVEFAGVAIASPVEWFGDLSNVSNSDITSQQERELEKAKTFVDTFGGKIYKSYTEICTADDVDAIYLPLPPALHFRWAKLALANNKHALVEKPFTINLTDTEELIALAKTNKLAVHEDYMFVYHNQIQAINEIIASGEIGKVRHYRIQFGFPKRAANDFRYNKALGGGALFDAGGYTIKYASLLLGDTARLTTASTKYEDDWEVDIFGSATMVNNEGVVAQLSFGMDNNYKCMVEAWGSEGTLTTGRVLTAPDGFEPDVIIRKGNDDEVWKLPSDEAFVKSIQRFVECINCGDARNENYLIIERQAKFIEKFIEISNSWIL